MNEVISFFNLKFDINLLAQNQLQELFPDYATEYSSEDGCIKLKNKNYKHDLYLMKGTFCKLSSISLQMKRQKTAIESGIPLLMLISVISNHFGRWISIENMAVLFLSFALISSFGNALLQKLKPEYMSNFREEHTRIAHIFQEKYGQI